MEPSSSQSWSLSRLLLHVNELLIPIQVLRFMRTNISTSTGRQLVGVWLKGAAEYLQVTSQVFTKAVKESGLGYNQDKCPFLKDGCKDTVFTDRNIMRRSCSCAYLEQLPSDVVAGIRRG